MKSETVTIRQLFQDPRQYRVPFYQRSYVWNREDQWERLWSDIQEKADTRLSGDSVSFPHFLGAVVLEPQPRVGLLGVETLHIIDGQQRLTTLQYLLTALSIVLQETNNAALIPLVEACVRNPNISTMQEPATEIYKVWPTFRDRKQYCDAMSSPDVATLKYRFPESFTLNGSLRKVGIDHPAALEAIWFFHNEMKSWLSDQDSANQGIAVARLAEAILTDLSIVAISLGESDDAQIIFETLNGHGAELHATDLIRNFIFMRADREGAKPSELYDSLWSQFESDFWRQEQRRGRLIKPRLEWFVQTSLQARSGEEIDVSRLYAAYRQFAAGTKPVKAPDQLAILNGYAEKYRQLISGNGADPIANFGSDIQVWDASTTHSLAIVVATSGLIVEEQRRIFQAIVSYLVRRAICGLTTKSYNKIFIQLVKRLFERGVTFDALSDSLLALEGEASRWPRDDEFQNSWTEASIYPGNLDTPRIRWILSQLEKGLRSARTEEPIPLALESLDVDHILPTSWYEHWPLPDGSKASETEGRAALFSSYIQGQADTRVISIGKREHAKSRMGNLTLLHYGVNRSLQNYAFEEKNEKLFSESNLQLNRKLMRVTSWDEAGIEQRGQELFGVAQKLWPITN